MKVSQIPLSEPKFALLALPFGVTLTPVEFTIVVKEVKFMAQARNVRIHLCPDDWLMRVQDRVTSTSRPPWPCVRTFQLCMILVRLGSGSGKTHHREAPWVPKLTPIW